MGLGDTNQQIMLQDQSPKIIMPLANLPRN